MTQRVEVRGLRELQRELRKLDAELPRRLKDGNLEVAQYIADKVRSGALSSQQARAVAGIVARGEQRYAKLAFDPRQNPFVRGAFFGAKRFRQFPPWVGNQWEPGEGQGPYVVNPVIAQEIDRIIDLYGDLIDELSRLAFPD